MVLRRLSLGRPWGPTYQVNCAWIENTIISPRIAQDNVEPAAIQANWEDFQVNVHALSEMSYSSQARLPSPYKLSLDMRCIHHSGASDSCVPQATNAMILVRGSRKETPDQAHMRPRIM